MLRMMLILSRKAISFLENHRIVHGSCMIFQCSQIRGGISRNEKWNRVNEEGEKRGYREGEEKKLVGLICKKMKKNCSAEEIADLLEEDKEKVEAIYNTALDFAPDYNIEKIWRKLGGGKKTAVV